MPPDQSVDKAPIIEDEGSTTSLPEKEFDVLLTSTEGIEQNSIKVCLVGNDRYSEHTLPEVEVKDFRKGSQSSRLEPAYFDSS